MIDGVALTRAIDVHSRRDCTADAEEGAAAVRLTVFELTFVARAAAWRVRGVYEHAAAEAPEAAPATLVTRA